MASLRAGLRVTCCECSRNHAASASDLRHFRDWSRWVSPSVQRRGVQLQREQRGCLRHRVRAVDGVGPRRGVRRTGSPALPFNGTLVRHPAGARRSEARQSQHSGEASNVDGRAALVPTVRRGLREMWSRRGPPPSCWWRVAPSAHRGPGSRLCSGRCPCVKVNHQVRAARRSHALRYSNAL